MITPESRMLLRHLHHNTALPSDIRKDIIDICEKEQKERRRLHNHQFWGRGTSLYAVKRRARRVSKCYKCGALEHWGRCRKMPTDSQVECAWALRQDPVRLLRDSYPMPLRKDSYAEAMVQELCWARSYHLT